MITLVIPVYNEEPYLRRCLDSVANQTKPFKEVIIINDGSTDGSDAIIQEYCQKYNWIYIYQNNQGLSAARNAGIVRAKQKYITFLDSDDEYTLDAHQTMLNAIHKYPSVNFIQFNHLRHYKKLNKTVSKYGNPEYEYTIEHLFECNCWWGAWNKVIRRNAIEHHFRTELGHYGEDGVFILEHILDGATIQTISEKTVIHHFENPNSLTKSKTKKELDLLDHAHIDILRKHCTYNEPFINIKTIVKCIEICQDNPIYKQIREGK